MMLLALLSAWSLLVASAMRTSWYRLPVGASGRRSGLFTGTHHTSPPIRYRTYATSIASDDVGSSSSDVPLAAPSRCSSYEAASIIRNCTADDGLLVITCDASGRGGGTKHDGIASILRMRHAAKECSDGDVDLIDVAARRTVPSRTSSEVAAIALGMKRALSTVPSSQRRQVLILTDSEYSLDFYFGNENAFGADSGTTQIPRAGNKRKRRKGTAASMKGRGQSTKGSESREEAHRRSLMALMGETPDGILYSKVRSSSRGVGVNTADEDAAFSWDGVGFIDHDAADHLSSVARTVANSYDDDSGEVSFRAVKPLSEEDLLWLTNSDTDPAPSADEDRCNELNGFWQAFEVIGSDARQDRRQRNRRKTEAIEEMLGS
ncbi:hypothetical protein ACHAXT_000901 [Thalassiosira profunda]